MWNDQQFAASAIVLRAGHPEHFMNHPTADKIEVIENVGATELPWHSN